MVAAMAVTIIMRTALMSEVFILQWSGEMKSTNVVVVCLLILFLCSSWCGVAAATLLAKDEPIKRSFQTELMCTLWLIYSNDYMRFILSIK